MANVIRRTMAVWLVLGTMVSVGCSDQSPSRVEVFHKDREPSLRTLERTKAVLQEHENDYEIVYYLITDPDNKDLIRTYNLPDTHFPFAVVISGRYSAAIDGRIVHFLEFPLFMKGIGRHEGNWSMEDLGKVLREPGLLLDKNVLPEPLGHHHNDEPCPGELE